MVIMETRWVQGRPSACAEPSPGYIWNRTDLRSCLKKAAMTNECDEEITLFVNERHGHIFALF